MNKARILIVEDNFFIALDIADRLGALGYRVTGSVGNGEQALKLAQEQRPDLVLMDIRLQGDMDGIAAAAELRRRLRIPVIYLTAFSEDETLERAKLTEPYGYILKPFNDRELKSTIETALYKHYAEEEMRRLNRLYDVLSRISQAVAQIWNREELLSSCCRIMVERGEIDFAWIGCLDPATGRISPIAQHGRQSEFLGQGNLSGVNPSESQLKANQAILEGKVFFGNDCKDDTCFQPPQAAADLSFKSCASFPFRFQGEVYGALNLCVAASGFFQEREVDLLKEVALSISFGLDKIEADSQKKRIATELQNSEARYRVIFEGAAEGIIAVEIQDKSFQYVNPAGCAMFGYRKEDFLRLSIPDLHPPEALEHVLCEFEALGRSKKSLVTAIPCRHRDGKIFYADITASSLLLDAKSFLVCFFTDITERQLAEENHRQLEKQFFQAQKMEAIGTLAGGIAHDFNNILMAMMGYTEMAANQIPTLEKARKYLDQVLQAGNRAKDLVRQILTFSRRLEEERKPLIPAVIIKEALKLLRATLPATIAIRSIIDSNKAMLADTAQIHQVIMNLVTNAYHAMQAKGGVLEVLLTDEDIINSTPAIHGQLLPGPYIKLQVKDTGEGIDPDIISQIFEPYFTTKGSGKGTGLGLATVLGIVKSHHGEIVIESERGRGSVFKLFFPRMEELQTESVAKLPASLLMGRGRILVIDDEPSITDFCQEALSALGYEVTALTNSNEALEIFFADPEKYDLVITDLTMPKLTGVDLAQKFLKIAPEISIIICTGHNERYSREEIMAIGVKEFLTKPLGIRQLGEAVRRALKN